MTSALATLGFILAAWLSFAAATSLLVALVWRGATRWRGLCPSRRAGIALAAALAPAAIPTLLVLLCLSPGLAGALSWHADHCLAHGDHPHLCLVHTTAELRAAVVGALVLGAAGATLLLVRGGVVLARTRRLLSALHVSGRPEPAAGYSIAPSAIPFSFAAGLARRGIWMSSALVGALEPEQLDVVLEHERAHLVRRDPLRNLAAMLLSLPLWPGVRKAVLAELVLATEQACDELAGQRLGSRLRVAETLIAVERLAGAAPGVQAADLPAFGEADVAARVQSLLGDPPAQPASPGRARAAALSLGLCVVLWLVADPLHHLTEHWLRLLLRTG